MPGVVLRDCQWRTSRNEYVELVTSFGHPITRIETIDGLYVSQSGDISSAFEKIKEKTEKSLINHSVKVSCELIRRSEHLSGSEAVSRFFAMPNWCFDPIKKCIRAFLTTHLYRSFGSVQGAIIIPNSLIRPGDLPSLQLVSGNKLNFTMSFDSSSFECSDDFSGLVNCQVMVDSLRIIAIDAKDRRKVILKLPLHNPTEMADRVSRFVFELVSFQGIEEQVTCA
tara:strand:- start:21470 stop:22144 length:675 start_codon:yes stop_codon:yes gene_type:complete